MTDEQAKQIFNAAIAKLTDPDAIARIEVAREYFTNPNFRKALQDAMWEINQRADDGDVA